MSSRWGSTFGRLIRWGLGLALLAVVVSVALIGVAVVKGPSWVWDRVGDAVSAMNPFEEQTVDRSGPSVVQTLTELSEFRAASAHYETVVDIEKDVSNLPGWISGERVLYVGKGDVDAFVDFSELDERRVAVSEDDTSVTVTLPAPTVDQPVLDLDESYVYDREEGLITRFKGSDLEREAQLKAVEQMETAATTEDMLSDMAKESTTTMLRGLFGSLGYTEITVTFAG